MAVNILYVLGICFTVFSGMSMALQTGVNATLARHSGSKGFAATISFITGCVCSVIFMLIESAALRSALPTPQAITSEQQVSLLHYHQHTFCSPNTKRIVEYLHSSSLIVCKCAAMAGPSSMHMPMLLVLHQQLQCSITPADHCRYQ